VVPWRLPHKTVSRGESTTRFIH